eukprot:6191149-Amphidinium_carterae.1
MPKAPMKSDPVYAYITCHTTKTVCKTSAAKQIKMLRQTQYANRCKRLQGFKTADKCRSCRAKLIHKILDGTPPSTRCQYSFSNKLLKLNEPRRRR